MRSANSWRVALPEDWESAGFGLYVHWPFCESKCPYCDFNSHVASGIDQKRWIEAYRSEIARLSGITGGRILRSIFFGGGTPSLMEPETVEAVISAARSGWSAANDIEITLEANPTSVEAGRFKAFRDVGVNRISMGIQSLDDQDLQRLGRRHTAREARTAHEIARGLFERVSFDLIYARQDQTVASWKRELEEALGMAVGHLSLYQLTIEDGTAFAARQAAGKLSGLPDEDLAAEMFEITQEVSSRFGLPAYEVSNHARSGEESRHNLIYWRYGDYAGIGPGAHGRLTLAGRKMATESVRAPVEWLEKVGRTGSGDILCEALEAQDVLSEFLMMGLRLAEGVEIDRLMRLGGVRVLERAAELVDQGMIEIVEGRLRASPAGRPILNSLLRSLLVE
jgi:putative oxygen-independent coproporphyrinogen III oxidase